MTARSSILLGSSALVVLAALAACSDDATSTPGDGTTTPPPTPGGGGDGGGGGRGDGGGGGRADSGGGGNDDAGELEPTWTNVYSTIIALQCTGCHGSSHPTGLAMATKDAAYTNLVGTLAGTGGSSTCGNGSRVRVVAGDPDASVLFSKVSQATPACGARMPFGGSPLSQARIDLIRDWIADGAQDD